MSLTSKPRVLRPNFRLITEPAAEPVTLDEFREFVGDIPAGYMEDSLTGWLSSARRNAEDWTRRAFVTQTWRASFDTGSGFEQNRYWILDSQPYSTATAMPRIIELPRPPLLAVSSITTYAEDNTATVMSPSSYYVSTSGLLGRILLRSGVVWPTNLRPVDSIVIDFTCGYGTPSDVPDDIKTGVKILASWMLENREGQQASNAGGAVVLNRGAFWPAGFQTNLSAYRVPQL